MCHYVTGDGGQADFPSTVGRAVISILQRLTWHSGPSPPPLLLCFPLTLDRHSRTGHLLSIHPADFSCFLVCECPECIVSRNWSFRPKKTL